MSLPDGLHAIKSVRRVHLWYVVLVVIILVFGLRLFYLQVIDYGHYHQTAINQQLKEYQIPAQRGLIEAHDGDSIVPLVLNQTLYTLYADPKFITNAESDARFVAGIIGGDASTYEQAMKKNNQYDVLASRIPAAEKDRLMAPGKPGLNVEAQTYRIYPDGDLASQVLGFVNSNGQGTYGIEQSLNNQLTGKPGLLKAITDVNGVPLPDNSNNVETQPVAGKNVVLTLDLSLQRQVEQILQTGLKAVNAPSGSVIVMNPNNGAIVAMANYPTYNPAQYYDVGSSSVFDNDSVAQQLEVGSVMKTLTTSAALDQGVIQPNTTFQDNGAITIDGFTITNALPEPSHTISIQEILIDSLNTGAVHMLEAMGGGQVNAQARNAWYNYMVNHFQLGKPTGIEQSYEASGYIPNPNNGDGQELDLEYANSVFGQGVSMTMLQLAAAESSVLNGGTYYQPHLVDGYENSSGSVTYNQPKAVKTNVVKPVVGSELAQLMEGVFDNNYTIYRAHLHPGFNIGGKTGTAQIPVNGGYDPNNYNGTFIGFVGGNKPQYVIAVLTKQPKLPNYEYAGTEAAAPIFGSIVDTLINSGKVTPITN